MAHKKAQKAVQIKRKETMKIKTNNIKDQDRNILKQTKNQVGRNDSYLFKLTNYSHLN